MVTIQNNDGVQSEMVLKTGGDSGKRLLMNLTLIIYRVWELNFQVSWIIMMGNIQK